MLLQKKAIRYAYRLPKIFRQKEEGDIFQLSLEDINS